MPIKKSVTPEYLVCLEDGKKLKMLKRHLMTAYGMTPEHYRAKWNLPADYPVNERRVGFEWSDSARWQRITEVLQANSKVTLADAMALQNDDTGMLARRLVALLRPLTSDDANVKKGLDLLKAWDARDAEDSAHERAAGVPGHERRRHRAAVGGLGGR